MKCHLWISCQWGLLAFFHLLITYSEKSESVSQSVVPDSLQNLSPLSIAFFQVRILGDLLFSFSRVFPTRVRQVSCWADFCWLNSGKAQPYSYRGIYFPQQQTSINTVICVWVDLNTSHCWFKAKSITPNKGGPGLIPDQGTRSHVKLKSLEAAMKIKIPQTSTKTLSSQINKYFLDVTFASLILKHPKEVYLKVQV